MKVLLGFAVALTLPAVAFAHHWGHPAPAPELAAGLPAVLTVVGAFAATRFKRRG